MFVVILYDKIVIGDIEKVILKVDFGVILISDGIIICIVIFVLMEERCKEFVKVVKKYVEEVKVVVCNVCCDSNDEFKKFEKNGDIIEDEFCVFSEDV